MRVQFYSFVLVSLMSSLCWVACSSDSGTTTNTPNNGNTTYTTTDCTSKTGIEKVVCLANNFLATLSTSQLSSAILTLNFTNAKRWSNLPCGLSCRNGLLFSSLNATQLTAAKALIAEVSGKDANDGNAEFLGINAADDYLATRSGGGYSSGNYIIAFLGAPSTTSKWELQFGGHHYAQNITFENGVVVSATPSHQAIEPIGQTFNAIEPLSNEKTAMANMLASFTTTELASAKLSQSFSDMLMGPSATTFPTTKVGIKASTLSASAKAKVLEAMDPWLNDLDATTASTMKTLYTNELDNTYVAYSGNANGISGSATSFFTANADYVRIDGPSVWIEFICQNGVVIQNQIHYHTVYRDHTRDYIGLQ